MPRHPGERRQEVLLGSSRADRVKCRCRRAYTITHIVTGFYGDGAPQTDTDMREFSNCPCLFERGEPIAEEFMTDLQKRLREIVRSANERSSPQARMREPGDDEVPF